MLGVGNPVSIVDTYTDMQTAHLKVVAQNYLLDGELTPYVFV